MIKTKKIAPIVFVGILMIGCAAIKPKGAKMSMYDIKSEFQGISTANARRIKNGNIAQGMTKKMVRYAWGKPADIHNTRSKYGNSSQWVYGSYGEYTPDPKYVYFEKGRVTSIQN